MLLTFAPNPSFSCPASQLLCVPLPPVSRTATATAAAATCLTYRHHLRRLPRALALSPRFVLPNVSVGALSAAPSPSAPAPCPLHTLISLFPLALSASSIDPLSSPILYVSPSLLLLPSPFSLVRPSPSPQLRTTGSEVKRPASPRKGEEHGVRVRQGRSRGRSRGRSGKGEEVELGGRR